MNPPKKPTTPEQARLKKVEGDRVVLIVAMRKIMKTPLNSDYYAEKALKEIGLL